MKVRSILVSQPAPSAESSPYLELLKREKIKVDFRSFIQVAGVQTAENRYFTVYRDNIHE